MGGFLDYVKSKTGIGGTVGGRKTKIDAATGETPAPAPQRPSPPPQTAPEPEMEIGTDEKGMPVWKPKAMKKGGVVKCAKGGVIDRELLRRKAAVKQKRGC